MSPALTCLFACASCYALSMLPSASAWANTLPRASIRVSQTKSISSQRKKVTFFLLLQFKDLRCLGHSSSGAHPCCVPCSPAVWTAVAGASGHMAKPRQLLEHRKSSWVGRISTFKCAEPAPGCHSCFPSLCRMRTSFCHLPRGDLKPAVQKNLALLGLKVWGWLPTAPILPPLSDLKIVAPAQPPSNPSALQPC